MHVTEIDSWDKNGESLERRVVVNKYAKIDDVNERKSAFHGASDALRRWAFDPTSWNSRNPHSTMQRFWVRMGRWEWDETLTCREEYMTINWERKERGTRSNRALHGFQYRVLIGVSFRSRSFQRTWNRSIRVPKSRKLVLAHAQVEEKKMMVISNFVFKIPSYSYEYLTFNDYQYLRIWIEIEIQDMQYKKREMTAWGGQVK